MGRYFDESNGPGMPPRIKAAFELLFHTRLITEQSDVSIPPRQLTPLEKSVEAAALRTVQLYLLGEMDFEEPSAAAAPRKRDDDDRAPETVPSNS